MSAAAMQPMPENATVRPIWPKRIPAEEQKPPTEPFKWGRSETLALASHNCASCRGSGLRLARKGRLDACNCVLRSIFRICLFKFLEVNAQEKFATVRLYNVSSSARNAVGYSRPREEFCADFLLITRRTLEAQEWKLFRAYWLIGAEWQFVAKRLKLDRSNFFHAAYRIEQKLGRIFRELRPYPLFPIDEYFGSQSVKHAKPTGVLKAEV